MSLPPPVRAPPIEAETRAARLYRWSGKAWKRVALPDDTMPYALAASNVELIAGMADGRIIHSDDHGQTWTDTDVQAGPVTALAAD